MKKYKNVAGNSGVIAYESGPDFINVKFISGDVYTYTYTRPGKIKVEEMKRLALAGKGLSGYISKYASALYDSKINS